MKDLTHSGWRHSRARIAACGALALACLMFSSTLFGDQKWFSYKQAFELSGQVGIGANPVAGIIVLRPEQEQPFLSRVLLQTLQDYHFSVSALSADPRVPMVPQKPYETDVVPMSDDSIKEYNQKATNQTAVSLDVNYGLQYRIRYEINTDRDRFFYIQMEPVLYFRGAASAKWREYKKPYVGDYFAEKLNQTLKDNFQKIKPGEELQPH
jgi:hypothetical protein